MLPTKRIAKPVVLEPKRTIVVVVLVTGRQHNVVAASEWSKMGQMEEPWYGRMGAERMLLRVSFPPLHNQQLNDTKWTFCVMGLFTLCLLP